MPIDTLPSMTQSMRPNRSYFSSSNGHEEVPFHNAASISNGDDYDIIKNKQRHYQRSIGDTKAIEVWILSMPSFIGHLQQDDDANS
ncbi:hypothetical protein ES332_A07G185300v1 [Gossypium tomentosum]|uniref:Uncharacterized protein n=1 Tax=Gossypium tomentosum TaxID=34277 RepID=A0A5D2PV13_GOSTO|nr:hypothetical protein ES332_A07G185300v1 [Gossypium tomentosum]